jgi:hypothetical protein
MAEYSKHGYDMTRQARCFYVFVSADRLWAKVGMVSREDRLAPRLREVMKRSAEEGLRHVATVTPQGMNEHEAEDTEAAIRTWLARRTGARHTGLVDWMAVPPKSDSEWQRLLEMAAEAVGAWGAPSSPSTTPASDTPTGASPDSAAPLASLLARIVDTSDQEQRLTEAAIDGLLGTSGVEGLVADYFDPAGPFAGATFDLFQPGPPDRVTAADLLAVTFLDVMVKPEAVRLILGDDADLISRHLTHVTIGVDIWDASHAHLASALAAWDHFDSYHGIGDVIAGKLLARKRPRLVPVIDSVTRKVLRLPPGRAWTGLRAALSDLYRRERVEELRPITVPAEVSTLRVLDACAWMRGSDATIVEAARVRRGVPPLASAP